MVLIALLGSGATCVGVGMCGCSDVWVCGCVDVRMWPAHLRFHIYTSIIMANLYAVSILYSIATKCTYNQYIHCQLFPFCMVNCLDMNSMESFAITSTLRPPCVWVIQDSSTPIVQRTEHPDLF